MYFKMFYSVIRDCLFFFYNDFYDYIIFLDLVIMCVGFNEFFIVLRDIMVFVLLLKRNVFFSVNVNEVLDIDG